MPKLVTATSALGDGAGPVVRLLLAGIKPSLMKHDDLAAKFDTVLREIKESRKQTLKNICRPNIRIVYYRNNRFYYRLLCNDQLIGNGAYLTAANCFKKPLFKSKLTTGLNCVGGGIYRQPIGTSLKHQKMQTFNS